MLSDAAQLFLDAFLSPGGTLPENFEIAPSTDSFNKFGALLINNEYLPAWASRGGKTFLPISGIAGKTAQGKPIVSLETDADVIPLISETGGGRYFINFDPASTFYHVLLERYAPEKVPALSKLPFDYHALPEAIRSPLSKAAVKMFSKAANGAPFPGYPIEKSLEALLHILRKCAGLHRADSKPRVMLSHDVDAPSSVSGIGKLTEIEWSLGVRSVWFITGGVFAGARDEISRLAADGNEIGLHDVKHDLKLPYLAAAEMEKRLGACAQTICEFGILGFRSPYYLRTEKMFGVLEKFFKYDSSVPDCDNFTPSSGGGCALVRPYRIGDLVEIPATLPFEIPYLAGVAPDRLLEWWSEKIEFVRAAGGLLVVNTHPDARASASPEMLAAYRRLLEYLSDSDAQFILPREIIEE